MNEPIISPWLIYLINRVDDVSAMLFFGCLFFGIAAVVCWVSGSKPDEVRFGFRKATPEEIAKEKDRDLKGKKLSLIAVILVVINCFIPSSKECWQMLVASKVTPATIQATGEVAEDVTKKALELITDSVIKIMQEAKK